MCRFLRVDIRVSVSDQLKFPSEEILDICEKVKMVKY